MTSGVRKTNRRTFLAATLGAGVAAATGLHRAGVAQAQVPAGPVHVDIQDIVHGARELAAGRAEGARIAGGRVVGPGRYHGPRVIAAAAFTHVGLHWSGAASFDVRTSADGLRWTPWERLLIEATPAETPGRETYAALIRAPGHRYVEYRATLGSGESVESVTVTVLDTSGEPAAALATTADATGTPVTFTREDWGAEESLRFDDQENEIWPRMYVPHKKLVVHHTATSNSYQTVDEAKAEVQAIYAYHAVTLGWGDIGYNALIDKFGNVYEGRYGRDISEIEREVLSTGVVAGHALSHNYGSTGVAALGTYTRSGEGGRPGIQLTAETYEAFATMLTFEAGRNDVDPEASGDFLLFDDTWNRGLANVSGHRDCVSTICPGGNIYDALPSLRSEVASRLARAEPSVTLTVFPPEDTVGSPNVDYVWDGAEGLEYAYSFEGWRRIGTGEDIEYLHGFSDDRRLLWSAWSTATSASFADLADGHYTFHILARDSSAATGYRDARTFLLIVSDDGGSGDDPGNGEPPPDDEPASISLEATAYKVRGLQKVDLAWAGATTSHVDVYRDAAPIATVSSGGDGTGTYTDNIDQRGGGSYTYHVCEINGGACSNEVTVTF